MTQPVRADSTGVQENITEVAAVAQQSSASSEEVSASTQQTSASTQEVSESAQALTAAADDLNRLIARFKITTEPALAAAPR